MAKHACSHAALVAQARGLQLACRRLADRQQSKRGMRTGEWRGRAENHCTRDTRQGWVPSLLSVETHSIYGATSDAATVRLRFFVTIQWTEKLVVFLLGVVQHQVADVSWHSLGIDQGFLQTMAQVFCDLIIILFFICIAALMLDYTIVATQYSAYNITQIII